MHQSTFLGLDSTGWTAIYVFLTAGLVLLAVIAAIYTHAQWKISRQQASEKLRPYVTITVEPSLVGSQMFDLVIRNIGRRPAINTEIELTPLPIRAQELETSRIKMADMKILNEPIALLAPGQEIRVFYDVSAKRVDRADLPTSHNVSLSYVDTSDQQYFAKFTLDLLALAGAASVDVRTIHDIGKSLKQIEQTIQRAAVLQNEPHISVENIIESRIEFLMRERDELNRRIERFSDSKQATSLVGMLKRNRKELEDEIRASQRRQNMSDSQE